MKRIKVPLIEKQVEIYVGLNEYDKWKNQCIKHGCRDPELFMNMENADVHEDSGKTWGGFIWIGDSKNTNTIFHEVQHVISNIQNLIMNDPEEEFSAYIAGYINEKVFEWILNN